MDARAGKESFAVAATSFFTNEFTRYADSFSGEATYRQWFLLTMVRNMGKGGHSIREVAEFAGTTRQNARRMLEPLERRGLVTLRRSHGDARTMDVRITRRGIDYLDARGGEVSAATSRVFSILDDDEVDALVATMRRLMDSLDSVSHPKG